MRFARKLMLLAITAVAAMAFVAAPASATDAIQVVDEKTAATCPDLDSYFDPNLPELTENHNDGGCIVHAAGTVTLEVNFFGFWTEEDTCDIELLMRIDSKGNGAVYALNHYASEPDTSVQECETETPVTMCDSPWETTSPDGDAEETAAGTTNAQVAVCIDSDESDICGSALSFDIVEGSSAGAETYSVVFKQALIGQLCRITGTLSMESTEEAHADIHVNHL